VEFLRAISTLDLEYVYRVKRPDHKAAFSAASEAMTLDDIETIGEINLEDRLDGTDRVRMLRYHGDSRVIRRGGVVINLRAVVYRSFRVKDIFLKESPNRRIAESPNRRIGYQVPRKDLFEEIGDIWNDDKRVSRSAQHFVQTRDRISQRMTIVE